MDACNSVERELDKLLGRFDQFRGNLEKLDDLIKHIQSTKNGLDGAPPGTQLSPLQAHIISACGKKIKDATQKIATEHKEIHSSVSKVGKAIDRNFVSDFTGTTQEGIFSGNEAVLLNEAISEHLLRQGHVDVADMLIQEANLTLDEKQKEPFLELNRILEECKNHNVEPALRWVQLKRDELQSKNSSLEFKLHRLKFIDLVKEGQWREALEYSKNFSRFTTQIKEIQRLMGCFAFMRIGLENSPYSDLLDPVNWLEINDILARDACTLLGLSISSPLEVSVTTGCIALPTLLQIKQVMRQRQCTGVWSSKEELPVEIELENDYRFHSIFACPILRQQCGRTNPPMRLVCGHAISKDALNKLVTGNKLKCPYCPMEMDPKQAQQIRF
ncbi:E3 ubiquitin-protein ligase RMND5A-like isoform X2 [Rhopilema esculentum]|uniref:E3 ubiquitin-protein ligase RMND5A-like isoform X2 n=2 Tax=Rhopilema esculentum TaxID=499914 RepID=UPI0031D05343